MISSSKVKERAILYVEDNYQNRRLVRKILLSQGYKVLEAEDGNDGISKLDDNPDVALIFTDINMPWMNGLEMVEEIKSNSPTKNIPICMLTTETSIESLEKAKELGVNAFLVKPVQEEQVIAVINNFIGK